MLAVGFLQDRRLRADVLFIRAKSAIRADGSPSAQERAPQFELPGYILGVVANQPLRVARANRIFRTDEKRIRTENAVIDKGNSGSGLVLCEIATLQQREGAI